MTESNTLDGPAPRNIWRIARWTAALALLLTPLAMMQISDEWHWTIGSFVFAGIMIGGVGLLYEFAERVSASRAYRAGVAIVLAASFLTVWTTIVRDDGTGIGYFMVVLAAGVGGFGAWLRAAGMARTMLGVAVMQALLGVAIATAPMTAAIAGLPLRTLAFNGFFVVLWLIAAAFFAAAAKGDRVAVDARQSSAVR
jgi:hypothetical protein